MKERGFTLLEVLVATVIMAIAITGLLTSLSTSLRNAAKLTDYDRAAQLARRKMDELLISNPEPPKNVPLQGAWDPGLTGGIPTGWRAKITTFDKIDAAGPGTPVLDRVELEIWWMIGDERKTFTLEGFRRGVLRTDEVPEGQLTQ